MGEAEMALILQAGTDESVIPTAAATSMSIDAM
jgi:hypothetical protein